VDGDESSLLIDSSPLIFKSGKGGGGRRGLFLQAEILWSRAVAVEGWRDLRVKARLFLFIGRREGGDEEGGQFEREKVRGRAEESRDQLLGRGTKDREDTEQVSVDPSKVGSRKWANSHPNAIQYWKYWKNVWDSSKDSRQLLIFLG
jgi:hypothetical protein